MNHFWSSSAKSLVHGSNPLWAGTLSWKRGPPWEGKGEGSDQELLTRLPALRTVCIFQESNVASNLWHKMTAEQLSISFPLTELIASDTRATAERSLLGDWFWSLAINIASIFKDKRLSQCRDYAILCFLKKSEVGNKLRTRTGRRCWKLLKPAGKSLSIAITSSVKEDQTHKQTNSTSAIFILKHLFSFPVMIF